jgi:hypothetical protein
MKVATKKEKTLALRRTSLNNIETQATGDIDIVRRQSLSPREGESADAKMVRGPFQDAKPQYKVSLPDIDHAEELRAVPPDVDQEVRVFATNQTAVGAPDAHATPVIADAPACAPTNVSDAQNRDIGRNGDETDAVMDEIAKRLADAAMLKLTRCELTAEWVHYAEAKLSVFGQLVPKPQGGRPESGITRAARELQLPGKSPEARRKYVKRALKITAIWPEAKAAARDAGLDDNQFALLAIADEKSLKAQLAKIEELANRKAQPRGKKKTAVGEHAAIAERDGGAASENLTAEEEAQVEVFKRIWANENVLKRTDWDSASFRVHQRFARDVLLTKAAS